MVFENSTEQTKNCFRIRYCIIRNQWLRIVECISIEFKFLNQNLIWLKQLKKKIEYILSTTYSKPVKEIKINGDL